MNTYNINDKAFQKTKSYKDFVNNNPKNGFLKIRAYAASQAIPIKGLKILISKNIDNNNVIFFEGDTNESGVIEGIVLPAPVLNNNDLIVPNSVIYDITATYFEDDFKRTYKINIYENVYVVQNINIVPSNGGRMCL